jgi:Flp pilus assembly protein TadG
MGLSLNRNSRRYRFGGVIPLTVLCLSVLAGVVALVIDGGTLMEARRHVQAAADASALAGAADLFTNYPTNKGLDVSGSAQASALTTASANGYTNDGVQSTVTINVSPQSYQSGPNAGTAIPPGYIEVIIRYNASHLFSGIFGVGTTPVVARAVARGRTAPLSNNSVTVLNANNSSTLSVASLGSLKTTGGLAVNTISSSALNLPGSLGITSSQFSVTPSVFSGLGGSLSLLYGPGGTSPTFVRSPTAPDPLRFLPVPNSTTLGLTTKATNLFVGSGTVNLYPGIYAGGIRVAGTATVILHANSDGSPGIYYLEGSTGLQVLMGATVMTAVGETAGVMIFNDWSSTTATINLSSTGKVSLIPPSSGTYRGVGIFQKAGTLSSPGPTLSLNGNGTVNMTGTVYAAHAAVSLSSKNPANVMAGQIVADTVSASGSVYISSGTQPVANERILGLVE